MSGEIPISSLQGRVLQQPSPVSRMDCSKTSNDTHSKVRQHIQWLHDSESSSDNHTAAGSPVSPLHPQDNAPTLPPSYSNAARLVL
ncbi:hypothetical protein ILYODFUR_011700 [Ilyodon furcidens]|uniref:Uncharacterized protein n=1 Tax=Ilyodon furcidens TaxID=33524 RepID=A0ABV0V2B3_9TELE